MHTASDFRIVILKVLFFFNSRENASCVLGTFQRLVLNHTPNIL